MSTAAGAGAGNLLDTIIAATRRSVAVRQSVQSAAAMEREQTRTPEGAAFERAVGHGPVPRIIAECKRRSPSRGILRQDYDPALHARSYADAGAAAISVLTEPTFFDGSLAHLRAVRASVRLPLLRKDFIVSDYQLAEAAAAGADAVLLIVGALSQRDLAQLFAGATSRGLAVLVEVHDVAELGRAVDAGARIVGINSRDLRTLSVDLGVLDTVAAALPAGVIAVAESGIRTSHDLRRLSNAGYHAFLVGERLIAETDPGAALRELRGA